MFGRISTDAFGMNGPNGSKLFVMPDGWPAVAASDGVLWSAGWSRARLRGRGGSRPRRHLHST